jgi:dolichol kinase
MNSMADIVACMVGFWIAARLPKPATIALTVGLEIVLLVWTRDNLTLNIVMLFYPNGAIRAWQMGH